MNCVLKCSLVNIRSCLPLLKMQNDNILMGFFVLKIKCDASSIFKTLLYAFSGVTNCDFYIIFIIYFQIKSYNSERVSFFWIQNPSLSFALINWRQHQFLNNAALAR